MWGFLKILFMLIVHRNFNIICVFWHACNISYIFIVSNIHCCNEYYQKCACIVCISYALRLFSFPAWYCILYLSGTYHSVAWFCFWLFCLSKEFILHTCVYLISCPLFFPKVKRTSVKEKFSGHFFKLFWVYYQNYRRHASDILFRRLVLSVDWYALCMCVWACMCMRVCVRVCARACVHAFVCGHTCVFAVLILPV